MYAPQRGRPVERGSQRQTSRPDQDGGLGAPAPERSSGSRHSPAVQPQPMPMTSPTSSSAGPPRTALRGASPSGLARAGTRRSEYRGRVHRRRSSEIRRAEHWRTTPRAMTAMITRTLTSPDTAASDVRKGSIPSTLRKVPGQKIGSGVDRKWSRRLRPRVETTAAGHASMRERSSVAAELVMNSLRGATSLPISRSKTCSEDSRSPMLIRRSVRWRGSIVVSAS